MKAERTVALNGLRIQARIGIHEFEREMDVPFQMDISLSMACELKEEAVLLKESIDYEVLLLLVQEEMKKPEFLLESVVNRIALRAKEIFPDTLSMSIHLQKKNPPLNAEVDSSSVKLTISF